MSAAKWPAQGRRTDQHERRVEALPMCPVCGCPMSVKNPVTCQNCDYQTTWTKSQTEKYLDEYELALDMMDDSCEE